MDKVLGLDSHGQGSCGMDKVRAAVFVRAIYSMGAITGDDFSRSRAINLLDAVAIAKRTFEEAGYILDDDDIFADICLYLQRAHVLQANADDDNILVRTKRTVQSLQQDDEADLDAEVRELLEEYSPAARDDREIEIDGSLCMVHPKESTTRGLARAQRAVRAGQRSTSGQRAVGDQSLVRNEDMIGVSGHAAEFVTWCAQLGGTTFNGVTLPECKEVSAPPPSP